MEIRLFDPMYVEKTVIDSYASFIWTDRYYECGDFELKMPASLVPNRLKTGWHLGFDRSEHMMIIENIQLDRTNDEGNMVTISGRSLESLLDRRVIYECINFKSNGEKGLEYYIELLLKNNAIAPSDPRRIIRGLDFEQSGLDTSKIEFEAQHQGCGLYDTICSLCKTGGVGWKIIFVTSANKGKLSFVLYTGNDHSLAAERGTRVVFSDDMNNLAEIQYLESTANLKNVAVVFGDEDSSSGGKIISEALGRNNKSESRVWENRREVAVTCSSSRTVTNESGQTVTLSDDEYKKVLKNAGSDELTKYEVACTASGNAVAVGNQFKYGRDYALGDLVTVDLGIAGEMTARVVETTFSMDIDGFQQYQSFETVERS